ncbi:MAG: AAA family ATPase [Planctomycetaceae bacterium]|jgi:DNA polymerase III delta prime subunit|nr:AAA family ATPase [Planctomycetaceae bacterium]
MSNTQLSWIDAFERETGIRRAILLHGDILDVYSSPKNPNDYVPIQKIVCAALRRKGFTDIILWDKFNGAQNVKPQRWNEIQQALMSKNTNGNTTKKDAVEYDMGEDEAPQEVSQSGTIPPNIDDFLPVVYHHLTHQTEARIAFILDWSQYLFGTNSSLSEEDRQRLLMLSKSINNAPLAFGSKDEFVNPANLLVLLTSKLGNIPSIFYQGNACVKEIIIPSPGRTERAEFLDREHNKWNLSPNPILNKRLREDFIDVTDGLMIRDLLQLVRLSQQQKTPLSFAKLVNLYRYGEQKSPWEDLSKDKLRRIAESLKERVKGQDDAVEKVKQVIIRAYSGLAGVQHSKKQRMPKGILFFVGPTGVGKTELAKSLAEFLFGEEETCIRFDMSEFNHEHSDQRLVGAPPGYVGYEEGGQLTNAVKKRPFAVLLFDEIEKAHQKILDKFLQILEDGRLTDGKGDTVSFSETVIIFTSNIGASEVGLKDANGNYRNVEEIKNDFIEKVKEHFTEELKRPELLNRIGNNIVPFNFITDDRFLFAIAKAKIKPIKETLKEKYKITDMLFENEQRAFTAIFSSLDKSMGGRSVLNEIVKKVIDPLSLFLFEQDEKDYINKKIIIRQKNDLSDFIFTLD